MYLFYLDNYNANKSRAKKTDEKIFFLNAIIIIIIFFEKCLI